MFYKQVEQPLSDSFLTPAEYLRRKDELRTKPAGMAKDYGSVNVKRQAYTFPLGKEHFVAIRQLKTNDELIVTRPDKGVGYVLKDRKDYVAKMLDILNDSSKFVCLGDCETEDKTDLNEKALKAFLFRELKEKRSAKTCMSGYGQVVPRDLGCMACPRSISQSVAFSAIDDWECTSRVGLLVGGATEARAGTIFCAYHQRFFHIL